MRLASTTGGWRTAPAAGPARPDGIVGRSRAIAATNRDLRQLVAERLFQEDLYYRLQVIPIVVPPLRDRAEDIPPLLDWFVHKHSQRTGKAIAAVDDGVITALQEYHWPGNVRELENTIERAIVLTTGSTITRDAVTLEEPLPSWSGGDVPSLRLRENVEWIERETIRRALGRAPIKRRAGQLMGISPRALSHYLAKYPTLGHGGSAARLEHLD